VKWEADERPEPRSLGLLPSGPDPVGEWLVHRQPPGPYIGRANRESKLTIPLLPFAVANGGEGRKTRSRSRAALFVRAPSFSASHESFAPEQIKGRRSADRRRPAAHRTDARAGHRTIRVRTAPNGCGARLALRRARLSAPRRGSRQSLAALAQSGPALHGSANGGVVPSAARAASSWQTGVVAGRASFRTASRTRLRAPSRAPLPLASIGRHRLTSLKTSEMTSFSSSRGAISTDSENRTYLSDPAQIFFCCLFDSRRHKCGRGGFAAFSPAIARGLQAFSNCGSES